MSPMLDVSEVLTDVDMAESFSVLRRVETVNNFGESTIQTTRYDCVIGVVNIAAGNQLKREPEMQYMRKTIHIVTSFRLQGPTPGVQPDIVLWHGSNFLVEMVDDYSGYGGGFIQATATSINTVDAGALPQP